MEDDPSYFVCKGIRHEQERNRTSCAAVEILHPLCHSVATMFSNSTLEQDRRHHTQNHADISLL